MLVVANRGAKGSARERSVPRRDSTANGTNVTWTLGPRSDAQKVHNRYPSSNKLLKAPEWNAVTTKRMILRGGAARGLQRFEIDEPHLH